MSKVKISDIDASGTRNSTTYLSGDGTFSVPIGGGGGGGNPWYWLPPSSTDFPTVINTAGTGVVVDDVNAGLILYQPSGGARLLAVLKAIPTPSADWEAVMRIDFLSSNTNYSNLSIVASNGNTTSDKSVWLGYDSRQAAHYMHYNLNATYDGYETFFGLAVPANWFKMSYVASTGVLSCFVSGEGKVWVPFTTDGVKAYFGSVDPQYIGLAVGIEGGSPGAAMAVVHYGDDM